MLFFQWEVNHCLELPPCDYMTSRCTGWTRVFRDYHRIMLIYPFHQPNHCCLCSPGGASTYSRTIVERVSMTTLLEVMSNRLTVPLFNPVWLPNQYSSESWTMKLWDVKMDSVQLENSRFRSI